MISDIQHHKSHANEAERYIWANVLLDHVRSAGLSISSILDVGCGYGWLLAAAREKSGEFRGVGIDGPWINICNFKFDPEWFVCRDLAFDSIAELCDPDLIVSLETAEHLPSDRSESFIKELTSYGRPVLFSAAIPKQGGQGHVNEKWQSFWVSRFLECKFEVSDYLHSHIWTDCRLPFWLKQNPFIAYPSDITSQSLRNSKVSNPLLLNRVHPDLWLG